MTSPSLHSACLGRNARRIPEGVSLHGYTENCRNPKCRAGGARAGVTRSGVPVALCDKCGAGGARAGVTRSGVPVALCDKCGAGYGDQAEKESAGVQVVRRGPSAGLPRQQVHNMNARKRRAESHDRYASWRADRQKARSRAKENDGSPRVLQAIKAVDLLDLFRVQMRNRETGRPITVPQAIELINTLLPEGRSHYSKLSLNNYSSRPWTMGEHFAVCLQIDIRRAIRAHGRG